MNSCELNTLLDAEIAIDKDFGFLAEINSFKLKF